MGNFLIKCLTLTFLLSSISEARENPFFPKDGMEDITYSSNMNKLAPPLKRATMKLPSNAREIQQVTISYKNLDGSIEEQTIELNNSIDWHLPIFISQSYDTSPEKIINTAQPQKVLKEESTKKEFELLVNKGYIDISSLDKTLKIDTKNELMRDFLLVKPHRIVLDFKKVNDEFLKQYSKEYPQNVFKSIKLGNHKDYYRVVIELDGYYRYTYEQTDSGYIFKLI